MAALTPPSVTIQYRKPVRGSLVWWLRFCGVVSLLIVLLVALPKSQEVRLARIDLRWLGLCMLLTVLQLLLEAFVWQWLLSMQRIRHAYPKTLIAYLSSQYLGLVTPGHVGELLAAGYISMDTGLTFGYALSSVVMKKVFTWITVVGFGILGLPLLASVSFLHGVKQVVWISAAVVAILAAGIALWVVSLRRLARKWERLSPWQIDMTEFWAGMRQLASPKLIPPLCLAAVTFGVLFLQMDAILRSMGVLLPLVLVSKIMGLSRIAARIVPMSMVGLGSKDAALILLLTQQGLDPSVGVAAALLFYVCSYLVTLLLSGVCWWIKPLIVRRVRTSS